jgi:hypothetical protein
MDGLTRIRSGGGAIGRTKGTLPVWRDAYWAGCTLRSDIRMNKDPML